MKNRGFTLVELAMVLLIIGLLLGGLLMPLATQVEQRDRRLVEQQMEDIKRSLLGYAVIHQQLPCPASSVALDDDDRGLADDSLCDEEGFLPWRELGVPEADAWGSYWRYRLDSNFSTVISLDTSPDDDIEVVHLVDSEEKKLTATGDKTPVAVIYSLGPDREPNGINAQTPSDHVKFQGGDPIQNEFDDITIWLSRPLLFNTLLSARVLPD